MDGRQERGLQIAALSKLERNKLGWKVPSQSGNGSYVVNLDGGEPFCTCPDFANGNKCKHIFAVEFTIQR
ncbi:MAG: Transposase, partial [Dehalococcoidia bacterium]|nr:Transposase [Dehalococcoidia bacterium]